GCTRLAFDLADPRQRPALLVSLRGLPDLARITVATTAEWTDPTSAVGPAECGDRTSADGPAEWTDPTSTDGPAGGIAGTSAEWSGGGAAGGGLLLGAMATHAQVAAHPAVRATLPVLAEAFARVGNVRVREVATVGGVLAGAGYAWDPPTVLLALGARVRIAGPGGAVRIVPLDAFYPAPGTTVLRPGELITAVEVDAPPTGTVGRYQPFKTRSAEDTTCLGVAVTMRVVDGVCAGARIAIGSGTPVPVGFGDIDAELVGRAPDAARIRAVADAYADAVVCVDDLKASAAYRAEMVRVWVRRTLAATLAAALAEAAATPAGTAA
ncbi:FAD binding domain-containing protein, partial [Frankia sp. AiPs1]|uniref:FAD binding domain-containing protein n=1 Tax=Frankia sp. AiPs1 TaxID=573493 RepID=UPI0020435E62